MASHSAIVFELPRSASSMAVADKNDVAIRISTPFAAATGTLAWERVGSSRAVSCSKVTLSAQILSLLRRSTEDPETAIASSAGLRWTLRIQHVQSDSDSSEDCGDIFQRLEHVSAQIGFYRLGSTWLAKIAEQKDPWSQASVVVSGAEKVTLVAGSSRGPCCALVALQTDRERIVEELTVRYRLPANPNIACDGGTCCICLEQMTAGQSLRRLACFHRLHHYCAMRFLVKKPRCPLCRTHVGSLTEGDEEGFGVDLSDEEDDESDHDESVYQESYYDDSVFHESSHGDSEEEVESEDGDGAVYKTIRFHPGPIDMEFDLVSGEVLWVYHGQAKAAGIRGGWRIVAISGMAYSVELLDRKIAGSTFYEITFKIFRDEENTAHSGPFAPAFETSYACCPCSHPGCFPNFALGHVMPGMYSTVREVHEGLWRSTAMRAAPCNTMYARGAEVYTEASSAVAAEVEDATDRIVAHTTECVAQDKADVLATLESPECWRCGCTCEVDEFSDRMCWCDSCWEHGCERVDDEDSRGRRIKFAFQATSLSTLCATVGDLVEVLEWNASGWILVKTISPCRIESAVGWVPHWVFGSGYSRMPKADTEEAVLRIAERSVVSMFDLAEADDDSWDRWLESTWNPTPSPDCVVHP